MARATRADRKDDGLTKLCKECSEVKSVDDFYSASGGSGYRARCKPCYNVEANRRAKERGYVASDEVRGKARKTWEERNPGWRAEYQLDYQRRNSDAINARRRKNYAEDPTMVKRYVHKRRALLANAEGFFTDAEWKALLEQCDHRCLKCGSSDDITPDHVVPLSRGGSNWIDNIQPLCRSCNARKHVDDTDYRRTNDHCEIPV